MFNLKNLLARLLLAVSLTVAVGQAAAGPIYRINIDTASLGAGPAYLGLYFLGLADASPVTATVTALSGAFTGAPVLTGAVSGTAPGPLVFGNQGGGGDFVQAIMLGGAFAFDLSFLYGEGTVGTTFGWALFDAVQYLGADGDLGNLFLQPGAPVGQQVTLTPDGLLSSVVAIPEPGSVALLLLACGALLAVRRR